MFDPCLACDVCKLQECSYWNLKNVLVRIDDIGQAKVGDMLLLVEKDGKERRFISRVSSIPFAHTDREEVVFDTENNYYFILEMYLKRESWIKDAYIIKNALSPNQVKAGCFND